MRQYLSLLLFQCTHRNTTWPQRTSRNLSNKLSELGSHYVVCTECGTELPYDWSRMRVSRPSHQVKQATPIAQGEL